MTEHDDLRDWDAAYLFGSLSADDRRRYERHLADCAVCASSVAEVAGVPGLLARVPAREAEAALEQPTAPAPDLLPRLVDHVARRRRRVRRWVLTVSVAGVAVVAALGVVIGPRLVETFTAPTTAAVQLHQVGQSSLEASIRLVEEQWGTRIEMECHYDAVDGYSAPADYAMIVTDNVGDEFRVATWTAGPGQTATPSGSTSLTLEQISRIEVRSVADGSVLLRGSP